MPSEDLQRAMARGNDVKGRNEQVSFDSTIGKNSNNRRKRKAAYSSCLVLL